MRPADCYNTSSCVTIPSHNDTDIGPSQDISEEVGQQSPPSGTGGDGAESRSGSAQIPACVRQPLQTSLSETSCY